MIDYNRVKEKEYFLDITLMFPDEIIKLRSIDIVSFYISSNFLEQLLPISVLTFGCSDYIKEKIQKYKNKMEFNIILYIKEQENFKIKIFDKNFIPFFEDENKNIFKEEKTNKNEEDGRLNTVSIFIFEKTSTEKIKQYYNFITTSCNTSTVALYILKDLNKEFLITPFDDTIHNQIIIPGLILKDSVIFLQKVYGLYKEGIIFFIDYFRGYLLSKSLLRAPVEPIEFKNIDIYVSNDSQNMESFKLGDYTDMNEQCIKVSNNQSNINFFNFKTINNRIEGEKQNIKSKSEIETTIQYMGQNNFICNFCDEKNNVKTFYDYYNNPYNKQEFEFDKQSKSIILKTSFKHYNLYNFTPNKRYNFFFESNDLKQYNGVFRLDSITHVLHKKEASGNFFIDGECTFTINK